LRHLPEEARQSVTFVKPLVRTRMTKHGLPCVLRWTISARGGISLWLAKCRPTRTYLSYGPHTNQLSLRTGLQNPASAMKPDMLAELQRRQRTTRNDAKLRKP